MRRNIPQGHLTGKGFDVIRLIAASQRNTGDPRQINERQIRAARRIDSQNDRGVYDSLVLSYTANKTEIIYLS